MSLIDLIKNLRKRTHVEDWEINLLLEVFRRLPAEYVVYERQIEEGLIAGVILSNNPRPNYVNFTYDPRVSKKYEKDEGRFFCLKNIQIFDRGLGTWNDFEVYITHGLVCGYSLKGTLKANSSFTQVDVNDFKQMYLDDFGLQLMRTFLNQSEIELINPSDFYEITVEGREYYHVHELEDGDFIGIDRAKKVYKITHDPLEVRPLDGDIISNLSSN